MNQFTVIANTLSPVLYINFGDINSVRLFSELINCDPSQNTVNYLQTASQDFKDRLHLLDVIGERAYEVKKYFAQIPTGQHYFFLPGRIEDCIQIYIHAKQLSQLDNVTLKTTDLEGIYPYLYDHYEVRTFSGSERINIGVYDKAKRVCRFCGRSMPDVKFSQKAHAISESLGNKGLICREECDDCNHRFNETIEQDVTNLFQFNLILKGIKGKNGIPTMKGNTVSITNDTKSQFNESHNTLVLKVKEMPNTKDPQEILDAISKQLSFPNNKYVPQNIYKCFCKYVLSLIDSQYLPYFKGTIDWINEPPTKHKLPPIWHYEVSSNNVPFLAVMLRKHNYKELPFCWAILNITGLQFLFILPFCSRDKYKFVGKTRIHFFLDGLKKAMPNITFLPMKLNDIKPVSLRINANFNIPPDCVEGRDYYFITPNKKPTE